MTVETPAGSQAQTFLAEITSSVRVEIQEVDPSALPLTQLSNPLFSGNPKPPPWNPYSWRAKPVHQAVTYANPADLESTCALLSRLPDLLSPREIESAREAFHAVARGKAFIIQGGDCAESLDDATHESVLGHMSLLAQEAAVLSHALGGKPVVEMGRIAGQYAKPRSNPVEVLPSGETVPAFRGENINAADPRDREPDLSRLLLGYMCASTRLQMIAQIRHGHAQGHGQGHGQGQHQGRPFYTSHEALHIPLEAALTKDRYNTSATLLWVGARTAHLEGAHIEYIRGLRNPLGLKVSASTRPDELVRTLDVLCPGGSGTGSASSWGRVALITRLGVGRAAECLPALIRAVQLSGHMPVWLCDPCHGNTETTVAGRKTRRVDAMLRELQETYVVHRRMRNYLGGIHLEQTGKAVTECLDSSRVVDPDRLDGCYETLCDPRLARDQALSLVRQFADFVASYTG